jgi:formylglycine-generating enzyme required for sulfatase activity
VDRLRERAGALPLDAVLRLPGHLAIIGDAGSGKTTVLHVLTSVLAARSPEGLAPDLAAALPDPRPLPVLLPLRLFEQACDGGDGGPAGAARYTHCPDDLLRFLDAWFRAWCPQVELPDGFLAAHVQAGWAWLLLDALDEVADAAHRETVRNVIQELAGPRNGTRLIVTARVAAYRTTRLDDRFTVVTVRDLDEAQRAAMVQGIYRGLALPDHERRAGELQARFEQSAALRALGRTPVMVWTAAVIHALEGELPEGRAALYDRYVDILLRQSFKRTRYNVASLDALVDDEDWPLPDRLHYLTYAAFKVHERLAADPARRQGDRVVVGEGELVHEVLAPYLQENLGLSGREARRRARAFLTLMVERSGLVYESDQGYTFGDHLTMQEFLAGYYLAENFPFDDPAGYARFLQERVGRAWWREVVLLAAGYLGRQPGFRGRRFLEQVAARGAAQGAAQGANPEGHLIALALAGRGLLQLRAWQRTPTWYGQLTRRFAGELYTMLYAEPVEAPVAARQEAGLVLGQLYGMPGNDAGGGDPRFSGPLGLPDFVAIPAGRFWMGSTEAEVAAWVERTGKEYFKWELPRHEVALSAFEVARYPTTNAMFAHFVDGGGYDDARWWGEAIEDGYWDSEGGFRFGNLPRYWDDDRWNNPSQPVVGVSWYEAAAYCRWLTAALDDGYRYRLPTEAEWERAARGSRGWRYPWGDVWAAAYCNSKEAGLEQTSPVGGFPSGVAEGGLHDMVGNVWEWCRDWFGEEAYKTSAVRDPLGPASGVSRILRGGSYYSDGPFVCRCAYRDWYIPWDWSNGRGFRCVRTLSS